MRRFPLFAATGVTLALVLIASAVAAKDARPGTALKPDPDTILEQMSHELSSAHEFSFKGTRTVRADFAAARGLQPTSQIEVHVRRPDAVVATSVSSDTVRSLYFDGKQLSMLDGKKNMYATVPLQGTLDTLPVQLAVTYGFVPPLAEFVISNPYKDLRWRSSDIVYVGTESCRSGASPNDQCYRLSLSGKYADSELWIAVSDHLPRKLIANLNNGTKNDAANPALTIEFTDWNLAAPHDDQMFVFVPPKDAVKIPMVTTAEIAAAAKSETPKAKQ